MVIYSSIITVISIHHINRDGQSFPLARLATLLVSIFPIEHCSLNITTDIIRSFKPTSTPEIRASPDYPRILTEEMYFDIAVAKASLLMDVLSHTLVTVIDAANMEIFVVASMLTSLGGGALPSLQSLAVCVSQVHGDQSGIGVLFGAIGFLQAVGTMILGVCGPPMMCLMFVC